MTQKHSLQHDYNAGLSQADIQTELELHGDEWKKAAQRPKENVKYNFSEKEQIDYIREATSKNVWYSSHSCNHSVQIVEHCLLFCQASALSQRRNKYLGLAVLYEDEMA